MTLRERVLRWLIRQLLHKEELHKLEHIRDYFFIAGSPEPGTRQLVSIDRRDRHFMWRILDLIVSPGPTQPPVWCEYCARHGATELITPDGSMPLTICRACQLWISSNGFNKTGPNEHDTEEIESIWSNVKQS